MTRTFTLDDAEAAWEASRHDGCKDDGCRWDAFRTALLAAKPETAETPEQVCERLGIDVPKWAAEIRAKVAAAAKPEAKTCEGDGCRCVSGFPGRCDTCLDAGCNNASACKLNQAPAASPPAKCSIYDTSCIRPGECSPDTGCLAGEPVAASPPAWLPLGQHPEGTCRNGCGVHFQAGDIHGYSCWHINDDSKGSQRLCFCSRYCRDRAKAVPRDALTPEKLAQLAAEGRRLGREFGERTRAMTGPSAYVDTPPQDSVTPAPTGRETEPPPPGCLAVTRETPRGDERAITQPSGSGGGGGGDRYISNDGAELPAKTAEQGIGPSGGQPGIPDGWRLGENWTLVRPGWKCHGHGVAHAAAFSAGNGYSVCLDLAKAAGAIVPAEPSRPARPRGSGLNTPDWSVESHLGAREDVAPASGRLIKSTPVGEPSRPIERCPQCSHAINGHAIKHPDSTVASCQKDGCQCDLPRFEPSRPATGEALPSTGGDYKAEWPAPGNHQGTPSPKAPEARTVDCPECGAKAGQPCNVPKLSPIDRYHIPRFEAARVAPGKPDEAPCKHDKRTVEREARLAGLGYSKPDEAPLSEQIALMRWAFDPGDNRRADVAALSKKVAAIEARLADAENDTLAACYWCKQRDMPVVVATAHLMTCDKHPLVIQARDFRAQIATQDARIAELTAECDAADESARSMQDRLNRLVEGAKIAEAQIAELTTWRAAAEAAAREFEARMDRAIDDKSAAVLGERERAITACETSIECFRCSGAGSITTGRGVVSCGVCNGNRWLAPNSIQVAHRIKNGPDEFPGVQREGGAPAPTGTP